MKKSLWSNPFFLREWRTWRREMPPWKLRGSRAIFVGTMALPFIMAFIMDACSLGPSAPMAGAWTLAATLWLLLLTALGTWGTAQQYHRERDLGTLQVASMTAVRPWEEAVGRWAGALIAPAEGWLMGLVLVVAAYLVLFDPREPFLSYLLRPLCLWSLSALWCGAVAAMGLYFSAVSKSTAGSLVSTGAAVVLIPAVLECPVLIYGLDSLHPWTLLAPPNPMALFVFGEAGFPQGAILLALPLWLLFTWLALQAAAGALARGRHLRVAEEAVSGPRGLMPTAPGQVGRLPGGGGAVPWHGDPADTARAQPPGRSWLAEILLKKFDSNPFYVAYRRGFARLYTTCEAAPGSSVPAGLMLCAVSVYGLCARIDGEIGAPVLLGMMALATFFSVLEGFTLGSRALQAERDRATWPLLTATGISPGRVLAGKFAAAFYALSGEWAIAMPVWLLAAVLSGRPAMLALAPLHPAAVAMSIVAGLWFASQPRYLVIRIRPLLLKVFGGASVLYLGNLALSMLPEAPVIGGLLQVVNPGPTIWRLAASADVPMVLGASALGTLQALLAAGLCVLVWRSAVRRLDKVMRGE